MAEAHAITRIRERYGVDLKPWELKAMADRIKAGEGLIMTKNSCHSNAEKSHWVVALKHNDVSLKLIYAPEANWIVTALPANSRTGYGKKRKGREVLSKAG